MFFEPPDRDPATNTWVMVDHWANMIQAHSKLLSGLDTEVAWSW